MLPCLPKNTGTTGFFRLLEIRFFNIKAGILQKYIIQIAMMPCTDVFVACIHCIQMLHPKDRGWPSNNRLTSNLCQLWTLC